MDTAFYREYFEIEDKHWWFVGRREILLRLLDDRLPATNDLRLLDVGCGTGTMVEHLSRFGEAEGVDTNADAIAFCHERGVERTRVVDDGPLPYPDDTFDLVTALDVVEHVADDVALLRDLRRVLRPGGSLVLMVPAYWFLWGRQDQVSHHHRRYVARELRMRLDSAGLSVRRVTYFNTLLFPIIAGVRLLRRARDDQELKSDFTMTKPGAANSLLGRVFASEARLLDRRDLPFGVSILALATREGEPG